MLDINVQPAVVSHSKLTRSRWYETWLAAWAFHENWGAVEA